MTDVQNDIYQNRFQIAMNKYQNTFNNTLHYLATIKMSVASWLLGVSFRYPKDHRCRSQWLRGLRRRSAAPRLLRLWVRIPPEAWMFVVCCQVEVSATG